MFYVIRVQDNMTNNCVWKTMSSTIILIDRVRIRKRIWTETSEKHLIVQRGKKLFHKRRL